MYSDNERESSRNLTCCIYNGHWSYDNHVSLDYYFGFYQANQSRFDFEVMKGDVSEIFC